MNFSKIHHIAIIVSDYEAAKNFYVNKLGVSVVSITIRYSAEWRFHKGTTTLAV